MNRKRYSRGKVGAVGSRSEVLGVEVASARVVVAVVESESSIPKECWKTFSLPSLCRSSNWPKSTLCVVCSCSGS